MKFAFQINRIRIGVVVVLMFLSACSVPVDDASKTGSGVTIDVRSILRGFADAGSMVTASVRSLWSDAQKRADDIAQGAEKIKEGKELMERGVRGE
ncbi:MAG: hypothetical protein AAB855_02080 [Patescibacteria group bacterium]